MNFKQTKLMKLSKKIFNLIATKAQNMLSESDQNKQLEIVKKLIFNYTLKTTILGIIIPALLTFLQLILPEESENIIFSHLLKFYPYFLFCVLLFFIILWTLKIYIWRQVEQNLYRAIHNDYYTLQQQLEIAVIEKNKHEKIHSFLNSIVIKIKNNTSIKELTKIIAFDILHSLNNDPQYSIGIYEAYQKLFWMPCYETRNLHNIEPQLYTTFPHNVTNSNLVQYYFYRCLHGKEDNINILQNNHEIKGKFKNASDKYTHYSCCQIRLNEHHKVLLEIVAHKSESTIDEKKFEKLSLDIFEQYIPLLMLIFGLEVSPELKPTSVNH